jgi:glycosyltransferase involved in cell wall biosynthesis
MAIRVAFATNFISPYRVPLYVALGKTDNWDLKLFTCCESEFDRQWKPVHDPPFSHKQSFSVSYRRMVKHQGRVSFSDKRHVHIPLGLWLDLWRFRPDLVISDEMGARTLIAAAYALLTRKQLVIWFHCTLHTERDIAWKQRLLRKVFIRMADAFIGMGIEARRYLESLGVESESIFDAKNAVDIGPLESRVEAQRRITVRRRLGVSGLCFLYAGRINQLKGVEELLEAWDVFCAHDGVEATLVLAGDGQDRPNLENRVARRGLTNVRFVGHVEPEELPEIYHAADVFVFPTLQDVWGLVVNEAMTFGLPIICSKYAGCAPDLMIDGRNGWLVDPKDPDDVLRALRKAWDARDKKEDMAKAARESVAGLTIPEMAEGFRRAVEYARPRPKLRSENPSKMRGRLDVPRREPL